MRRITQCLLGTLLLLACTLVQAQRSSSPLGGTWQFQRADVAEASSPTFDDAAWQRVTLPHTWNAPDGEVGGAYYRGPGWYRRVIERPLTSDSGRRQFLEFDGATLATEVWVNGQLAGRHQGGYARFRFDVTALLQPGRNVLAVRVDNSALPQVAPLGGDFTVFGGLIRPVRLIDTDSAHINLLDDGGPGMQVDTETLTATEARLKVRVQLRNDGATATERVLRLRLRDTQGHVVLEQNQPVQLAPGGAELSSLSLQLPKPHPWQGVYDPYLYRLSAELLSAATVTDAVELPLGLRQFKVDLERGFLLNDKPYPLHGVNYFHAGRPGRGVAVGDVEIDEDLRTLMELGATGLRLVHYQHPPHTYERADELGLVLWTEIPLNSAMQETEAFRSNLFQQLQELVRQNRHHASVAIWGLGNEVYRSDEPIRALLADLHTLAKQEDPSRLTTYAHCCAADDHPMALQTDLVAYNRYWGWYDGELTDVGPWADKLHAKLPSKPIGLGEYGAGASALQQEDPPKRPVPNSRWHPEQYQALFHEAYARQIAARPFLWGTFVWLGFDHASAGRNEGDASGINDKGLVSYDRKLRKDAYYLYQAYWRRQPMVHISSSRFSPRSSGEVAGKAYTNGKQATLTLDGHLLGAVKVKDHAAQWSIVALTPGRHRLSVSTDHGASDAIEWVCTP